MNRMQKAFAGRIHERDAEGFCEQKVHAVAGMIRDRLEREES